MMDGTPKDASLSASDVDQLAALHARCLPTSLPARLGGNYLRYVYRYADRSPYEIVLPLRCNGACMAAATISLRPKSLGRRLLLHTPLAVHVPRLIRLALIAPGRAVEGDTASPTLSQLPAVPELVWIFVDEGKRGANLGGRLLSLVEIGLETCGYPAYFVRTFADAEHAAARFYRAHGFRDAGMYEARRTTYRILSRQIGAGQVRGDT